MARAPGQIERIAFLGKGGIGKSAILANLAVIWSRAGRRVLHVGCDPKRDSSALLTDRFDVPTVVDQLVSNGSIDEDGIVVRGRHGVDFIEAGGPEPGVGCAGRGIARMLEFLEQSRLVERRGWDTVLFDLLGDIVCGGFATPLRRGSGRKVFIVTSDELMSLWAANNIARAVVNCAPNGVVLGGIVANFKDQDSDPRIVRRFASAIGTRVVAVMAREPRHREAEYEKLTLVEKHPRSRTARSLERLADDIIAIDPSRIDVPRPLADAELYSRARGRFLR